MSNFCILQIIERWKIKTYIGDKSFRKKEFNDALNNYLEAICYAEVLTFNSSCCVKLGMQAVDIYIQSNKKLTETYKIIDRHDKAIEVARNSISNLVYLMRLYNDFQQDIRRIIIDRLSYYKSLQNFLET